MHRNTILSILLVLFVFASASVWAAPDIDDDAPDFNFTDLDGNTRSFHEEYSDTVVVLEWFSRY